jgi:hypothetical protein
MFPGLALIAVGVLLLLEKLGVIERGLGTYWPVILIILGAGMLLGGRRGRWWWYRRG